MDGVVGVECRAPKAGALPKTTVLFSMFLLKQNNPDNPSQPRQIDITIKRDGKLTLVECRHHRSRQNVKWIEEMMGRRVSLEADCAIAVSSSGFTSGALNALVASSERDSIPKFLSFIS